MRDNRDPEKLGQMFFNLRRLCPGASAAVIADEIPAYYVPDGNHNPSCVDKYGRADEVKPKWEEIRVR